MNKNILKSLTIVPISEAKSVLNYSLTKVITPGVFTESKNIKDVKM